MDSDRRYRALVVLLGALCATTAFAQRPAVDVPPARTMRVTVVGPDKQPLAGARVTSSVWTKDPYEKPTRNFMTDAAGQVTVPLPKRIDILRLWARAPGHVALFTQVTPGLNEVQRAVPDTFTFQLQKGAEIGGIVQNEDGQPIAGVRVQISLNDPRDEGDLTTPVHDRWLAEGEDAVVTDERGQWKLDNFPNDWEFDVNVMLDHQKYISDEKWGGLQQAQNVTINDFRKRTGTIVMHRGFVLSGRVTDAMGKPVAGAVVVRGSNPYGEAGSQEVRTNDQGEYRLPPLPLGAVLVTVVAKDWAPMQRNVPLSADSTTADFALQPGRCLRMHFIDQNGEAVPGVSVTVQQWRGNRALYNYRHPNVLDTQIPNKADNNGVVEWTWAPDNEVIYTIYKEGYQVIEGLRLTADNDQEFVIKLEK